MKSEWQLAILRLMLASPSEVRSLHSSTSPHFASQPPSPMEKFLAWLTATAIFARPCKSRFYQQAQPSTHRLWANRDAHTETVDHLGGGWVGGGGGRGLGVSRQTLCAVRHQTRGMRFRNVQGESALARQPAHLGKHLEVFKAILKDWHMGHLELGNKKKNTFSSPQSCCCS